MNALHSVSPEVLVATGGSVSLRAADLTPVVQRATQSPRRRARLCAHPGPTDSLHEMLICLARGTYVRPHRHRGKSESFHLIAGELDVVLFEDDGTIRATIRLGPYSSNQVFFYRLMEPCYHTVLVASESAVFHETTNGPFDPQTTELAPWAPAEGDEQAAEYLDQLCSRIQRGLP
jgi:cupin fold WbuC family metalloprotein